MPLVFLHGILGSIDFWPPLLPAAVINRRWISLGLPGHFPGRLPPGDAAEQITPQAFADVLEAALQELVGDQPAALVGYSTGGFAALNLAAHYPARVAGVLSIAGFALGRWQGLLGRLQSLAARGALGKRLFTGGYRSLVGSSSLFQRCLLMHAAAHIDRSSPLTLRLLNDAAVDARRQDPAAMAELFARIRRFDIRPLLPRIQAPVIVAGGERDRVIPFRETRSLVAAIPHAELVSLAGVGHLFHLECAAEFQRLLQTWVDRVPSTQCSTHAA
jgi:pimeloyl-ACP methyl ester carboxylesterase